MPKTSRHHGAFDVKIWATRTIPKAGNNPKLLSLLSEQERAKATAFRFAKDRDLYVSAHAMLRSVLARQLSLPPQDLPLTESSQGKPMIPRSPLHFNLSHSGQRALLAVSPQPVGVDLEFIKPLDDCMLLAQQNFSSPEISALQTLPAAKRQAGFYAIWTRKEAYVKALGTGLSTAMKSFSIPCPPATEGPVKLTENTSPSAGVPWHVAALTLDDPYAGAVCAPIPDLCWEITEWFID